MFSFIEYVSKLDLDQLGECRAIIHKLIMDKSSPNSRDTDSISCNVSPTSIPLPAIPEKKPIEELVGQPRANFLTVAERDLLKENCKPLNFQRYTAADKIQNRFITPFHEPYIWESKNGPIVNKPIPIDDFPVVKDILSKGNSEYNCNLNCCLVSYFKNGTTGIRLHHDNEDSLDHTEPIVVVSIGAVRRIEFIDNEHEPYLGSDLILDPSDCSAYVMHPGTQQYYRHRVRCNKRVRKDRFSFSFRAFLPEAKRAKSNEFIYSTPTLSTNTNSQSLPPTTPVPIKLNNARSAATLFKTPVTDSRPVKPSSESQQQKIPAGYSPYPPNSTTLSSSISKENNKKLCLILGSSITLDINGELLSKGNRTVINCSETGANLSDVSRRAKDFYVENINSAHKVDQIILNVGTNDVKYFNGREHDVFKRFRPRVINLVKSLKFMFPHALIVFQSVLPIKIIYNYTALTVDLFNQLLHSVCVQFGCIFYDCNSYNEFIGDWEYNSKSGVWFRDYNSNLYRDKFHLNNEGIILLVRHIKCIIYGNIFNPHPRLTYHNNHFKKYY